MSADEALRSEDPDDPEEPLRYRSLKALWPEWHRYANCLGVDVRDYFGASSHTDRPAYTMAEIKKAQSLCRQCPVFRECLQHALDFHEEYGVWAGTTRKQRVSIFKDIEDGLITKVQVIDILTQIRR